MPRRFEYTDGKSNKFWEIDVSGKSFTVHYGRIGTDGQTQKKTLASPAAAQAEAEKHIAERVKKGYREVTGSASTSERPGASAPKKKTEAPTASPGPKDLYARTKISQRLFGGIVYFEDKTHYYVASAASDELFDSRDHVFEHNRGKGYTIGSYSDWYLPSVAELELMEKYVGSQDLGNFDDGQRYWSRDTYEDTDDDCGDAVPFSFETGEVEKRYDEYKRDLAGLKNRMNATYTDGSDYSGAVELCIRLVRKEEK